MQQSHLPVPRPHPLLPLPAEILPLLAQVLPLVLFPDRILPLRCLLLVTLLLYLKFLPGSALPMRHLTSHTIQMQEVPFSLHHTVWIRHAAYAPENVNALQAFSPTHNN